MIRIQPSAEAIHRVAADVAVVGVFSDERPLRGAAGLADWRLCGALSQLIRARRFAGAAGEAALVPSRGGLRAPLVLAVGLGRRAVLDGVARRERVMEAVARALALRVEAVAMALPPAVPADEGPADRVDALLESVGRAAMAAEPAEEPRRLLVVTPAELRPRLLEALRRRAGDPRLASGLAIEMPAPEPTRHGPAGASALRDPAALRVK